MGGRANSIVHTLLGYHPIEELLKSKNISGTLYLRRKPEKRLLQLKIEAETAGVSVQEVDSAELDRRSGKRDHRGALLEYTFINKERSGDLAQVLENSGDKNSLLLVLDGITDPHNLGAIIRSADQFSADGIIIAARRSAPISQVTAASSAGAVSYVPVCVVSNLVRAVKELKSRDYWVYGAEMGGRKLPEVSLEGKVVIILGSEGKGISRLLSEMCDDHVAIPAKGHVDSFNVSVAAGIIMYEIRRQQNFE